MRPRSICRGAIQINAVIVITTTTFIAHTFCASKPFCCFHPLPLEVLYAQILHAEQVAPPCDSDIYITHQHLLCDAAIGEQEITMNHPIKVSAVQRHKNHLSGPLNLLPHSRIQMLCMLLLGRIAIDAILQTE